MFGNKVEISSEIPNLDDYDGIFLGYPIWWWKLPPPIVSFCEQLKLQGKKVIPFATYGSSGLGSTPNELSQYAAGSEILNGYGSAAKEVDKIDDSLKEWLKGLHIIE